MNNSSSSPYTSLVLKLVGIILMISSLLDYLAVAIPLNWQDPQWQINFTSQIVDRGIIPMVGIAFFLVGNWIDTHSTVKSSFPDLKLPVFILASFLGLLFLLMVPLNVRSLSLVSNSVLEQIAKGASQVEQQLQAQYDELNTLSKDPASLQQIDQRITQIDELLASGEFEGQQLNEAQKQELQNTKQQLENLQQLARDPEGLEAKLSELQTQLRGQKLQRQNDTKASLAKQGIRVGLSSFMLSGGYIVIGWLGLKGMGSSKTKGQKVPSNR
ncbi:MAG: HpsJ family protein [Gomphosphaeria aponina SAG 52.96 = DSM 107014]|uniref:HpsJ family protein n=1 Tax=Gomphosphaeria aponina SAG 52.96 = DSM 107014 TaxID=1521640 RepID=A0A941JVJ7_9CHRO|nr:HpsJ family protein [Gomphosphaeria aponina SAG 52.96 = DSM 107014]